MISNKRAKVLIGLLLLLALTLGLLTSLQYGSDLKEVSCVKTYLTQMGTISNGTSRHRVVADGSLCNASFENVNLKIVNIGYCIPNNIIILDSSFFVVYQKIYIAIFVVSSSVVIVYYASIYRIVLKRGRQHLKTALILSIVTLIFIVAFLPSGLIALRIVELNIVIYYLYSTYNVANPIVYVFLNKTFRSQKFQASSILLWLYSPVCARPGRKPRRSIFSQRGSNVSIPIRLARLCYLDPHNLTFKGIYITWPKLRRPQYFGHAPYKARPLCRSH